MSHIASSSWFTLRHSWLWEIWPLITIRTITWSCAKSGFKNWTFTCRLLHPVGFFSLTYSSAAFAIWNHHQFGRKIHQKPRGPGQNEVGFGGIFQRLCSQSKMPLRVWELNCLEEPPNWKDSYGWNDWNSTETAWNFCRHHPQFTPESLVRMASTHQFNQLKPSCHNLTPYPRVNQ